MGIYRKYLENIGKYEIGFFENPEFCEIGISRKYEFSKFSFFKNRSNIFHIPSHFATFFIEENVFKFRVFSYHLEIAETLENATVGAPIRSRTIRLKKYVLFSNISSDIDNFRWLVQIFTVPDSVLTTRVICCHYRTLFSLPE